MNGAAGTLTAGTFDAHVGSASADGIASLACNLTLSMEPHHAPRLLHDRTMEAPRLGRREGAPIRPLPQRRRARAPAPRPAGFLSPRPDPARHLVRARRPHHPPSQ